MPDVVYSGLMIDIYTTTTKPRLGLTKGYNKALVVGPSIPKIYSNFEGEMVLTLAVDEYYKACVLTPIGCVDQHLRFGNAFGFTPDNRFREAVRLVAGARKQIFGAIPINDLSTKKQGTSTK